MQVSTIAEWLAALGLSEYAQVFAENSIDDVGVLRDLSDQDLKELGVPLGHRRKMQRAIAELAGEAPARLVAAVPGAKSEPAAKPAPKPVPKVQDTAERRRLTVMFCDLVGSTALTARLDPEDLRAIISAYHRCCRNLVERNGGFVAQYMGGGVLAYFGYPRAHEHDAEHAVRAALALVEAVPMVATAAPAPLQVRVGISTGLVVVGDLIGEGAAQEQTMVGETPNMAARLQVAAAPGAVVIGPTTRRLLAGLFEYHELDAVEVKGFDTPVQAYRVVRPSAVESRFEALRASTTPLVGRDEEIDLLSRRWTQAKRGDGQVVLICGEPGIGKSRVAQTLVERLIDEPHTRMRYFCSPHHQDSALYPSISQLERAAGFRREDTDEQRLAKLEAVLAEGSNDLREVVPLLAELLSIPLGDRYLPLNLTPQKRKERIHHAQVAQVEGLAARQPVLMVFEDVHWSDPTTREQLDLLIERVASLRVLVIITFRPEFAPPWIGRPHVTVLTLNRLPPRQRAEMIAHLTGGKALPRDVADQIVDRTDGVPLFIEELTKTVVESGIVTETGGRYAVTGPVPSLAIPTSLHASLLARLDRLATMHNSEIAQIGAALGRTFSHELISAVAGMPPWQVDDALTQLEAAELIFRHGTAPDAEYTFKHALVQDAAYDTLLRSSRQQLHGRIATTLEKQFPEIGETQPEVLARHCAEAGLLEKAVDYWLKAGRQAIARWAMTEAAAQLRKGLDLLPGLPDGPARQERELDLQIELGHALATVKGYSADEPGEAYARARQLCEELNRPAQLGPVLWGQFVYRYVRAELDQAESLAEELRHQGHIRNDPKWKHTGSHASGVFCSASGSFVDACAYCEDAISMWDPALRAFVPSPEDPYVSVRLYYYRALVCSGRINEARLRVGEALAEARRLSPFNVAYSLYHRYLGQWAIDGVKSAPTILRSADEILVLANEHGFALWVAFGKMIRGWCLGAAGEAAEGITLLLEGLADSRTIGCNVVLPFYLTTLGEIYGIAGRPDEGLETLGEAVELFERTGERWAEAETYRLRGTLLLTKGDPAAAEASFQQALSVARLQKAKFWELRAALDVARLWRDQDKRREARDLLAPIYGWFTEGLETTVLKDAKALLDQLAA
jgi:class 3 adenylate cyclase/predicted ATPase